MSPRDVLKGQTVLIVDDEPFCRHFVSRLCKDLGATRVITADKGSDGLREIIELRANLHLVIADMNMPGLFGLQLLWCIRTGFEQIRRDLAVIMVTGHSDTELVDRALALDVDGFLTKPVSIDALRSKIEKASTTRGEIKPAADYKKISITALVTQFGRERNKANPGVHNDRALLFGDIVCPTTLTRPVIAANGVELVPAGTLITNPLIEYLKGLSCLAVDRLWVE